MVLNFAFCASVFSQNTHGVAYYEYNKDMSGKVNFETSNGNEVAGKELMQKIQKSFEKTFELRFNMAEAVYQELQTVTMKNSSDNVSVNKLYSNLSRNVIIEEVENEWDSKNYLVKDSISSYNWILENSTKNVGDYLCYKASAIVKVSKKDLADYEVQISKNNSKSVNLLASLAPMDKIIIAWYTTDIPVSHGPATYQGLPGLILEVNDDGAVWSCSKLILNSLKNPIVKIPTRGKKILKKDFDSLVEKQLDAIKDEDGVIQLQIQEN